MRIAHLSDTHLGYRMGTKINTESINLREADVMRAFAETLSQIADAKPDLVVHAGDMFHRVSPTNFTIVQAFSELAKFRQRCAAPIVIIGGNHDSPRSKETGSILSLFTKIPGVYVIETEAGSITFEELDCRVTGWPSDAIRYNNNFSRIPESSHKNQVLIAHGMVSEVGRFEGEFSVESTRFRSWTYVALGDYHIHQAFGPNIAYAGSTEFTSTNIWEEANKPKGWILFDTDTSQMNFRGISTRKVIDLPAIDADGLSGQEVGELMLRNATWSNDVKPVVRQVIVNIPSAIERSIDYRVRQDVARNCLSYQIDARRPALNGIASGEIQVTKDIETQFCDFMDGVDIPGKLMRKEVVEAGQAIIQEVKENEAEATIA